MFRLKVMGFLVCLLLIMIGCRSHSVDDVEEEAEGVIRSLIQDLKAIHTREQLLAATAKLQKQFERLVSLIITAEELISANPDWENIGSPQVNHELSDQLRTELNRLYYLEGGRQIIEKCQEKALYRLDAFKKQQAKAQDHLSFYSEVNLKVEFTLV